MVVVAIHILSQVEAVAVVVAVVAVAVAEVAVVGTRLTTKLKTSKRKNGCDGTMCC